MLPREEMETREGKSNEFFELQNHKSLLESCQPTLPSENVPQVNSSVVYSQSFQWKFVDLHFGLGGNLQSNFTNRCATECLAKL